MGETKEIFTGDAIEGVPRFKYLGLAEEYRMEKCWVIPRLWYQLQMFKFRTSVLLLTLFLSFIPFAFAEIHFTKLKGVSRVIQLKKEYSYLSPEVGFSLARRGPLNTIVRYGDPKNPTEAFLKRIFNSPSDSPTFFRTTPLADKVSPLLAPSSVGRILNFILRLDPSSFSKPKEEAKLKIAAKRSHSRRFGV